MAPGVEQTLNALLRLGYGAAGQLARAAVLVAPNGESKLSRTLRARRGVLQRFAAWGQAGRDGRRPLLWLHATSVGEGLQARPVIELFRARRPDVQLAYTFYSPSAAAFAAALPVDFQDVLPFDTAGDDQAILDALRPDALVFSKVDLWPVLVAEAARRAIPLGMVSATLAAGSSRRSWGAAALLRDAYDALDAVGAVSVEDADRLASIGVRHDVVHVTGDTRYDQVWARAQGADAGSALLAPLVSVRPTLVAGSTWPADEVPLLAAWRAIRRGHTDVRLIIAPHEPTAAHLESVERWARVADLRLVRLGADGARDADVVLVDRVGVLGELYALADVAYVGGGFHSAGLHSVLEPAAFGVPVLFGPLHHGSRDARLLLAAGGGAAAGGTGELVAALGTWLLDGAARREAGSLAKETVRAGLGAAERSFELACGLLDRSTRRSTAP